MRGYNLVGQKFNLLTVIAELPEKKKRNRQWLCQCDCGNTTVARSTVLINGYKRSCGCLKLVSRNYTHKQSKTRLYHTWQGIKKRCYNKNDASYPDYGGRGITMYDKWLKDFSCFAEWANSNGYTDELTIERIDVNGNYEPNNCKWITKSEQNANTRKTAYITYQGVTKPLRVFCKEYNIKRDSIYSRMRGGKTCDEAFRDVVEHAPRKKCKNSGQYKSTIDVTIDGITKSLPDWCREYSAPYGLVYKRYKRGWDIIEAMTTPNKR